jgi:hypothetical protein
MIKDINRQTTVAAPLVTPSEEAAQRDEKLYDKPLRELKGDSKRKLKQLKSGSGPPFSRTVEAMMYTIYLQEIETFERQREQSRVPAPPDRLSLLEAFGTAVEEKRSEESQAATLEASTSGSKDEPNVPAVPSDTSQAQEVPSASTEASQQTQPGSLPDPSSTVAGSSSQLWALKPMQAL